MREAPGMRRERLTVEKAPPPRRPSPANPAMEAGRPLDEPVRGAMEHAFGHDFSRVRVHDGPVAAGEASGLGATAFTRGRDLYFGAGRYAPATQPGRRLLAHELAHVVQQEASGAADARGPARVVPPGHPSERAASAAARRAGGEETRGPAAPAAELARSAAPPAGAVVQRETPDAAAAGPAVPIYIPVPRSILKPVFDPRMRLSPETMEKMQAERAAPLRDWLDANTDTLTLLSGAGIVARVRRLGVVGPDFSDIEILNEARQWAARHDRDLPRFSALPEPGEGQAPPPPPPGDSDFIKAAREGITAAIDGVGIVRPGGGRAVISVTGATAGLAVGRGEVSAQVGPGGVELKGGRKEHEVAASISWGGTLGVSTTQGPVHFEGSLNAEKWEVSLSFPGDSPLPFLSELPRIFGAGEAGLRGIAAATGRFHNLSDIPDVAAAMKPHLDPVKSAVSAAKAVVGVKPRRVNFGVAASGPLGVRGAGAPGAAPEGLNLFATFTLVF